MLFIQKLLRENRALLSSISRWMDSGGLDASWASLSFPTIPFISAPFSPLSTSKLKHFFGEMFARLTFIEMTVMLEITRTMPSHFSIPQAWAATESARESMHLHERSHMPQLRPNTVKQINRDCIFKRPYCVSDTCTDCFTGIMLFHLHKNSRR